MRNKKVGFICFCLILGLFNLSMGCSQEPDVRLSEGYTYFRNFGTVHSIAKPNGRILVFGDVKKVWEVNSYIMGLRTPAKPPFKLSQIGIKEQLYGYFIYDKSKNQLYSGLSKQEFLEFLADKNISLKAN